MLIIHKPSRVFLPCRFVEVSQLFDSHTDISPYQGEGRMNELYAFINNKFDQLKESFIGDIKVELKVEILKLMKDQNEKITKL